MTKKASIGILDFGYSCLPVGRGAYLEFGARPVAYIERIM